MAQGAKSTLALYKYNYTRSQNSFLATLLKETMPIYRGVDMPKFEERNRFTRQMKLAIEKIPFAYTSLLVTIYFEHQAPICEEFDHHLLKLAFEAF